jgi:hypothetical protein
VNWQQPNGREGFQLSECGGFSVCRIGPEGSRFYEAWRTRAHPEGPHLIATNLPSADEARRIAGEDVEP